MSEEEVRRRGPRGNRTAARGSQDNAARTSSWTSHLTTIIPLVTILFVLLKAYFVARFSLTTAGALVSAAPLSVLIGTATSYLNIAVVLASVVSGAWLLVGRRETAATFDDSPDVDAAIFLIFVASVALFPIPNSWTYYTRAVLYVVGVTAALVVVWWVSGRVSGRRFGWLARIHAKPRRLVALFSLFLLAPTLNSAWVPAEVLVLRHPSAISNSTVAGVSQRTAYPVVFVLSDNGTWLTAMDVESRLVMRLPIGEVAYRQVCHYTGQPPNSVPLAAYLVGVRFRSPNSFCSRLVRDHEHLLDPLVVPAGDQSGPPAR